MTTRNYHRDGPPAQGEFWVQCARDPQGRYGLAVGEGSLQIGFFEEQDLPRLLEVLDANHDARADLFRRAIKDLPAFRTRVQQLN